MTAVPPDDRVDDDLLLAELAAAVRAGTEVPDRFVAAGKAAFTWRTVDAELARLVADSSLEPAAGGFRTAGTGGRWLTFSADGLTIELEVRSDALRGQLVPPHPGTVQVEAQGGGPGERLPVDEVGYFAVRPVPAGLIRLRVRTEAGGSVVTGWFTP